MLRGEKKLLSNDEVSADEVPLYRELSLKVLLNEVKDDEKLMQYLPDPANQSRPLNRKFVLRVLFAIRTDWIKSVAAAAIKARETDRRLKPEEKPLVMSQEMVEFLRKHVFTSSKSFEKPNFLFLSRKTWSNRHSVQRHQDHI